MATERLIGRHTGTKPGPLLICIGGMHGNEPAGIQALELMLKMLEIEPVTNPDFNFSGRIVGLRGNMQALRLGQRYIQGDLNRKWTKENVDRVFASDKSTLEAEDKEIFELLTLIDEEIADYPTDRIVVLDIHTTTAHGGIFSIATDDPESLYLAVELHAPVVTGMLNGIYGTSLHWFNKENYGPNMTAVVFEAGQHEEVLSVNRAIAAVTNLLRSIGAVQAEDVENRHDSLLIEYSKGLPKVASLIKTHRINPGDDFQMMPAYKNFQKVKKGELLAKDKNGEIHAYDDGLILMPLYQKQGEDGFFLIRQIEY